MNKMLTITMMTIAVLTAIVLVAMTTAAILIIISIIHDIRRNTI